MSSTQRIEAQQKALEIAKRILDRSLSPVEGAWAIYPCLSDLGLEDESRYVVFDAVRDETDHLPLQETRSHWNPQVLGEKLKELARIEDQYRDEIERACKELEKYLKGQQY